MKISEIAFFWIILLALIVWLLKSDFHINVAHGPALTNKTKYIRLYFILCFYNRVCFEYVTQNAYLLTRQRDYYWADCDSRVLRIKLEVMCMFFSSFYNFCAWECNNFRWNYSSLFIIFLEVYTVSLIHYDFLSLLLILLIVNV